MNSYDIISAMGKKEIRAYFGGMNSFKIFEAYEAVFGSVQIFAYEQYPLDYLTERYLNASQEEKIRFCEALDGLCVTPSPKAVRKGKMRVRVKELFRNLGCLLTKHHLRR